MSIHLDDQITDQLPKIFRRKFQSKSLDNLKIRQTYKNTADNRISSTTKTEADLTNIGCCPKNSLIENEKENLDDFKVQRSQSAPVSPTKFYDKEFTAFLQSEQQQQQLIADSFVYNIDLSDTNQTSHSTYSRAEIFDVSLIKRIHLLKQIKAFQVMPTSFFLCTFTRSKISFLFNLTFERIQKKRTSFIKKKSLFDMMN